MFWDIRIRLFVSRIEFLLVRVAGVGCKWPDVVVV